MMHHPRYIDGPSNIFRLTKENRSVCIIVDPNTSSKEQTLCSQTKSVTIKDYLMQELDKMRGDINILIDTVDSTLKKAIDENSIAYVPGANYMDAVVGMLAQRVRDQSLASDQEPTSTLHLHAIFRDLPVGAGYLYANSNVWNVRSYISEPLIQSIKDQIKLVRLLKRSYRRPLPAPEEFSAACLEMLEKQERYLGELLALLDKYAEMLSPQAPPKFFDATGLYYSDGPNHAQLMKMSLDLYEIVLRCLFTMHDYRILKAVLASVEMMETGEWQQTIVYGPGETAYRFLQVLVKTGYQITSHAYSRLEGRKDINQVLRQVPIEEYALLLTPIQRGSPVPVQCSDLHGFPRGLLGGRTEPSQPGETTKKIDGPFNAVRLEGEIEGVPKVVYLFFDVHAPSHRQTGCPKGDGEEVRDYIVRQILARGPREYPVDFMMELPISYHGYYRTQSAIVTRDLTMYINNLRTLFSEIHQSRIDGTDSPLENLRVHYLDIRDRSGRTYEREEKHYQNRNPFPASDIEIMEGYARDQKVTDSIVSSLDDLRLMERVLQDNTFDPSELVDLTERHRLMINILLKTRGRYEHPWIREALQPWFDTALELIRATTQKLNELLELNKRIIRVAEAVGVKMFPVTYSVEGFSVSVPRNLLVELSTELGVLRDSIDECDGSLHVLVTDIYLVRRLLDKQMIRNAIVYTGGLHSLNYLEMLIKAFDFRITHVSKVYLEPLGLPADSVKVDELTELLKDRPLCDYKLAFFQDPFTHRDVQCSDLGTFPDHFD